MLSASYVAVADSDKQKCTGTERAVPSSYAHGTDYGAPCPMNFTWQDTPYCVYVRRSLGTSFRPGKDWHFPPPSRCF